MLYKYLVFGAIGCSGMVCAQSVSGEMPAGATTPAKIEVSLINPAIGQAQGSLSLEFLTEGQTLEVMLPTPNQIGPHLLTTGKVPTLKDCTYAVNSLPAENKIFAVDKIRVTDSKGKIESYSLKNGSKADVQWIYAASAQSVQGTLTCKDYKMTYQMELKSGWNKIVRESSVVNGVVQILTRNTTTTNDVWEIFRADHRNF